METRLQVASEPRPKVAVISHERSGTHFLMNTLAANLGYVARPWWNFDFELGLNFHAPQGLRDYFRQVRGHAVLNILKSHHQAAFFEPFVAEFLEEFRILYIVREPLAVMASFWRLVQSLPWDEGPRTESPAAFMRAAPRGALLRYQKAQVPTMLERWAVHVEGWLDLAARHPEGIVVVRYEQLDGRFGETVGMLAGRLGLAPPPAPVRPSREVNVVRDTVGHARTPPYTDEDRDWAAGRVAATLRRIAALAPAA
ncbi:sulfotransferase domain-containing protein [Inmirania thermothiophila]|uniref:Sulfotransferase domain-containing protein n=1 Tax=Inmirania thermothiophila TaxID=1750597 RepID=A0A3N1YC06_9GAMM|nr:sulfotransferase domain-containing protein [Inmirania thermothiophila]ROR34917.1 sulfotransferase domain-containing protein [Inmirania thermothiophila]